MFEVPQKHVAKVVPEISRFANRQNAVSEADLTAHHPFHVKLEEIAEEVPVTATGARNTYWFYERMKGAHRNLLSEASSEAQRNKLLTRFPQKQKFTKTDLAKYHNTWARRPWMVARGATKNFTAFMVDLETGGSIPEKPDEDFFKQSIAKAILFREADKIIKAKNIRYESLKKINETSLANMIRKRQPYLFDRIEKVEFFRNIFSQN